MFIFALMERYTLRGYRRLACLTAAKTWQCLYILSYCACVGIVSLVRWAWKRLVSFVAQYPKTFIGIVFVSFILNFMFMKVSYRMDTERQKMRYDSLWAVKDSIERFSSFESGYSKGLHDGNNLLIKDGHN